MSEPTNAEASSLALPPRRGTPARIFTDCAVLGFTAWGGYMALLAQAQRRFVDQRRWVAEKDFLDLIALVAMLPGPQAVNAIAVTGYRLAGWRGFAAALSGIVLPGFCIILALWAGYAALTDDPQLLRAVTVGVLSPLAAILAQAAYTQSRKATPGRKEKALATAAMVLLLVIPYWAAPIYALAFGAAVAWLLFPAPAQAQAQAQATHSRRIRPLELALCSAPAGLAVFQIVPSLLPQAMVAKVGLASAGLATTLFGGGLVMVPLLDGLIVDRLGWLDPAGFSAGLAASQLTPGPVLGIATFAGMEVAGFAGALAATVGIYLPTAIMAVGASGITDRLKRWRRFQHGMVGVRCAVVGLIAGAAVSLLIKLPWQTLSWQCAVLAAAAAVVVGLFKQPPYVSLPIGVALAWLLL